MSSGERAPKAADTLIEYGLLAQHLLLFVLLFERQRAWFRLAFPSDTQKRHFQHGVPSQIELNAQKDMRLHVQKQFLMAVSLNFMAI